MQQAAARILTWACTLDIFVYMFIYVYTYLNNLIRNV